MTNQERVLAPFSIGTRMNIDNAASQTLQSLNGGTMRIEIPPRGLLHTAFLTVVVDVTHDGPGVPTWFNPLERENAFIRNIRVYNNANTANINISLYGLNELRARMLGYYRRPKLYPAYNAGAPQPQLRTQYVLFFELPFGFNDSMNFELAMQLGQSRTSEWFVDLNLENVNQVIGGLTNARGTVTANLELRYFEMPDPDVFASPNLDWMYVISEETEAKPADKYTHELKPIAGDLIRYYMQARTGTGPSDMAAVNSQYVPNPVIAPLTPVWTSFERTYNGKNTPVRQSAALHDNLFYQFYGVAPATGMILVVDAASTLDSPGTFSNPSLYYKTEDPSEYTQLETKVELKSNAGRIAEIKIITESIQPIIR